MKRIIIIICILFCTVSVFAAFEDYGWGTRAMALAGAYTGLADDGTAPFYNPAGVAFMEKFEVSFMYAGLLTGLDMESLSTMQSSLAFNKGFGGIAINWARFSVDTLYNEDLLILTYANSLGEFSSSLDENVYFGISGKMYKTEFKMVDANLLNDPVFSQGQSKSSYGVDLGCMINLGIRKRAYDNYRVGISVLNINEPDIGIAQTDRIPREYKGGFFYPIPISDSFLEDISISRSLVAFSVSYVSETEWNLHLGLENNFFDDLLSVRFGSNLNEIGGGLGFLYSLKSLDINVNYTFLYPFRIRDSFGSHRTSLSVRF